MSILQFIMDYRLILAVLGINVLISILYLVIISNNIRRTLFFRLPLLLQKAVALIFVGPLFAAPFLSQPGIPFTWEWTFIFGFLLIIAGGLIMLFAFIRIGASSGIKEEGAPPARGPNNLVGHPIYAGTLMLYLGLSLWQEAFIAMVFLPVSFTLYFLMILFEERDVDAKAEVDYPKHEEPVEKQALSGTL